MNQKKLRRLYREVKLQVRQRSGRWRALGTRRPMLVPDRVNARNARWSLDFVSDTFTDGRRFRVLAIFDDYTRECLALISDTSLSGLRVVRELDAIIRWRGRPDIRLPESRNPGTLNPDPGVRGFRLNSCLLARQPSSGSNRTMASASSRSLPPVRSSVLRR
jgi:transposase InsO family protein